MDDICSLWTFQESVDELKQKLQYTTYELEVTRKENDEQIKKLLQVVQTACKERDEAKAQLKKFRQVIAFNNNNKPIYDTNTFIPTPGAAPFSPDSPLVPYNNNQSARANSGVTTESNSHSLDTHKSQSHASSPVVDSISYPPAVSSPESLSNIGTFAATNNNIMVAPTKVVDQGTLVIEKLAKGKPLPQKGRLLQAVIEAGPLLQTLMVAGSLPRWRNPPGFMTHQIPPVNIRGCGGSGSGSASFGGMVRNVNNNSSNTLVYNGQISGGSMGMSSSNAMLDFVSGSSGSCLIGGGMLMPSAMSFDCQVPKRQRIQ